MKEPITLVEAIEQCRAHRGLSIAHMDAVASVVPELLDELGLIVAGWEAKSPSDLTDWEGERLDYARRTLARAEGRDAE